MATSPTVLIIGGGIGGLCLAHGLRRAGIAVAVFERTTIRTDWLQGYRIHINPAGSRALKNCLPPENWQRFLDTVSEPAAEFAFMTDRLDALLVLDDADIGDGLTDPADQHYGVSRISLREVLLAGLDDTIEFGREFERYEVLEEGGVIAHFADGSSAIGDLLVGADGANSSVRGQLLPGADRVDTGVVAIAGKFPLGGDRDLPDVLKTRPNSILPRGRGSLFTAPWLPNGAVREVPTDLDDPNAAYTLWGYADAREQFPEGLDELDGTALIETVSERIKDWSPELRRLVAESDPKTVNPVRLRSAAEVEPWPTGAVTLLGDAIHNMTPMAGIGANTALRDAELLRRRLTSDAALTDAVSGYEREMLDYGFAAVRLSARNAKQAASGNLIGRAVFRTVLRLAAHIPALRRKMFGGFGS